MNTTHRVAQLILLLDVSHPDDLPQAEAARQELLDYHHAGQPVYDALAAALDDSRYTAATRRLVADVQAQIEPDSANPVSSALRRRLLACALDRLRDPDTLAPLVEQCLEEAALDLDPEDHVALAADLTEILRDRLPHAADGDSSAADRPARYEVELLLHRYRQSPGDPTRWLEDPTSPLRLTVEETDDLERAVDIVEALKTFYEQSGL
jgi:hypothetical protein